MRVGFVGLGKLGLPVAAAMAAKGMEVYGHDPQVKGWPADPSYEDGFEDTIRDASSFHFSALDEVVKKTDVIFVAVQTPHEPRFEGVTPLPQDRADFDYSFLKDAVIDIVSTAERLKRNVTLAVISTVLPGTMDREIRPLLGKNVSLVYSPSFIAMGTTIRDFLDPEFILLGGDDGRVENVYRHLFGLDRPRHVRTTVENAELIKVAYNTFIGLKLAFANTLMEVCHKTGCDVDEVTGALKLARRRLISPAYLDGGMGDGGGCHPRDNIALSWLARELELSHDLFEDVMVCREDQARWLADLMLRAGDQPLAILGVAYKPGSHLVAGSAGLLVANLLMERGEDVEMYDPHASPKAPIFDHPHIYLIGCKHPEFVDLELPAGSVVIDPFRYMPDQEGVEVIRLGESQRVVADHGQARHGAEVHQRAA